MTEVLFYHLQSQPLERVLPELLEKSLERKWRAVVQVGSEERRDALDAHLWTFRDEGFLPHGTIKDGHAGAQPVYLTTDEDNPNGAEVRFLADGPTSPITPPMPAWCVSSTATIPTPSTRRAPPGRRSRPPATMPPIGSSRSAAAGRRKRKAGVFRRHRLKLSRLDRR